MICVKHIPEKLGGYKREGLNGSSIACVACESHITRNKLPNSHMLKFTNWNVQGLCEEPKIPKRNFEQKKAWVGLRVKNEGKKVLSYLLHSKFFLMLAPRARVTSFFLFITLYIIFHTEYIGITMVFIE